MAACHDLSIVPQCQAALEGIVLFFFSNTIGEAQRKPQETSMQVELSLCCIPKQNSPTIRVSIYRIRPSSSSSSESSSKSHSTTGVFASLSLGDMWCFGAWGTGLQLSERSSATQRVFPRLWSLTSREHFVEMLLLLRFLAGHALSMTIVISAVPVEWSDFSLSISCMKVSSGLGMVIWMCAIEFVRLLKLWDLQIESSVLAKNERNSSGLETGRALRE